MPPLRVSVDRARLVHYAGASGDRNPIHWDVDFAKGVGLPDVIAHGMFTMGAAAECVSAWCGDPGRIVSYGTKFVGMVVVPRDLGAVVEVSGKVTAVDVDAQLATVELTVTSQGRKILGRALAVVSLARAAGV
ncbi:MAG: MaoC/PaaZ C-terminal domain-containing protein [Micrococcales bacterium]|nr:MaoC/PaaZ C-terminal domain-containing protein [Micrococcales bacterium]